MWIFNIILKSWFSTFILLVIASWNKTFDWKVILSFLYTFTKLSMQIKSLIELIILQNSGTNVIASHSSIISMFGWLVVNITSTSPTPMKYGCLTGITSRGWSGVTSLQFSLTKKFISLFCTRFWFYLLYI